MKEKILKKASNQDKNIHALVCMSLSLVFAWFQKLASVYFTVFVFVENAFQTS